MTIAAYLKPSAAGTAACGASSWCSKGWTAFGRIKVAALGSGSLDWTCAGLAVSLRSTN